MNTPKSIEFLRDGDVFVIGDKTATRIERGIRLDGGGRSTTIEGSAADRLWACLTGTSEVLTLIATLGDL